MLHGRASARGEVHIIAAPQQLDTCTFYPGVGAPGPPVPRPRVGVKLGSGQGASAKTHRIAAEEGGVLQGRDAADRYCTHRRPEKVERVGFFFSH